jgi:hypothetical protein
LRHTSKLDRETSVDVRFWHKADISTAFGGKANIA